MVSPLPKPSTGCKSVGVKMGGSQVGLNPNLGCEMGENSVSGLYLDDPNKRVRKPYTITKSRENWTDQEHDKFVEALHLFDRDWKKIEAFIGTKSVIQIRSHAQKYFLKVQKNGTNEHLPPPRPKRKASHPYPHKAPKNVASQVKQPVLPSVGLVEPGNLIMQTSRSGPKYLTMGAAVPSWTCNATPAVEAPYLAQDDLGASGPAVSHNCSSSIESTPEICPTGGTKYQGNVKQRQAARVMPDFAQVYRFIGSVFDPNSSGHLQKLKTMDQIDIDTVLMLMENLSANLRSPEFENHRKLLSSYDVDTEKVVPNLHAMKPRNAIMSS